MFKTPVFPPRVGEEKVKGLRTCVQFSAVVLASQSRDLTREPRPNANMPVLVDGKSKEQR